MTMLLGGRVAEGIVFGSVTTGASDDLKRVSEITRSMVHEYAMGTGLSSQRVTVDGEDLSDLTLRVRDQEQRELADEAYRNAHALITSHREKLEELAQTLLDGEVIERKDIERIMAGVPIVDRPKAGELRVAATRDPDAAAGA